MTRVLLFLLAAVCFAEEVPIRGLAKPVEIIRDKWGIPHIYAATADDLFFAQGWITARDRLFQIDLWRRVNNGRLAEVLGKQAVARDRIARLVRYRGDWEAEWRAYSPDAKAIATAFTKGINAYIDALGGSLPVEFRLAGYAPGHWQPEDVAGRIAGLVMIRNITRELQRVQDIKNFGLDTVQKLMPPDPPVPIQLPKGLNLADITGNILRDYEQAIGSVALPAQGSNNWAVSGARSVTGKPLLASDPHRPVQMPSLRKTVHLVGPGWNVIGAGEPALPGIALGHNEHMGFGFTIVGIDQADLYVERVNPDNPGEYFYKGTLKKFEVVRETLPVKGVPGGEQIELRYTIHGPVIAEERTLNRAYALKWVGAEPGGAGYLSALALSRAKNWEEFRSVAGNYKVPSENLVYADTAGNIGWIASGRAPVRPNWTGLLPVPGDTGEYEWRGHLDISQHPQVYNPASGYVATANHNILPAKYPHPLGYEWALPFRAQRVKEMIEAKQKFSSADFQTMQQDVLSIPARRFQAVIRRWKPARLPAREAAVVEKLRTWDCRLLVNSQQALVFEMWMSKLQPELFGAQLGGRLTSVNVLEAIETKPDTPALGVALTAALAELDKQFGRDMSVWQWGKLHTVNFRHPLNKADWNRGPVARPGDANTVNSTSGSNFRQTNGASFRMILDLSDWDKAVMTNVPGESGDPASPNYSNLLDEWAQGRYHPMLYSRKAVEAAAAERIHLAPKN